MTPLNICTAGVILFLLGFSSLLLTAIVSITGFALLVAGVGVKWVPITPQFIYGLGGCVFISLLVGLCLVMIARKR